jgi:hypothetical protein
MVAVLPRWRFRRPGSKTGPGWHGEQLDVPRQRCERLQLQPRRLQCLGMVELGIDRGEGGPGVFLGHAFDGDLERLGDVLAAGRERGLDVRVGQQERDTGLCAAGGIAGADIGPGGIDTQRRSARGTARGAWCRPSWRDDTDGITG